MKKRLLILLLVAVDVHAQTLIITDQTSDVTFLTKHLAGRLEGSFKGVQGTAQFDTADLTKAYLKLSFATSTLVTNDAMLGPDFTRVRCFDPRHFPLIEVWSDSIIKLGVNKYALKGSLKVKGVTRSIAFPFVAKQNAGGYDFDFTFSFIKKRFGVHCGATTGRRFKIFVRAYAKENTATG